MFESVSLASIEHASVIILGKFQDGELSPEARSFDGDGLISAAVGRPDFTGSSGSIAEAIIPLARTDGDEQPKKKSKGKKHDPDADADDNDDRDHGAGPGADKPASVRVLIVGLGKLKTFKPSDVRDAMAAAARRLGAAREASARIRLGGALKAVKGVDLRLAGRFAGEAFGLLSWDNTAFKGKATDKKPRPALQVDCGDGKFADGFARGLALAAATNLTRTLSETPPNIATPDWMAEQAGAVAEAYGLGFSVIRGEDLEKERLTGHVNVGKASENKPCLIRLEYTPKSSKSAKKAPRPVVLIGKTMCYDTGGLSLKVNNGMVGMKRDKDGGCAVLGAMQAIASVIQPDVPVVALLCAAENSVSDEAYRPDDVLTFRNGVTVEITNTDAEGRLVLADGLCWACEQENPACIIDLATLTGGVVVALGGVYCGMFCEDDRLRARIEAAALTSGERVWRLPMHEEYREMMKSPIADILNSNPNRKAHPVQGAAFLSYFVEGYSENKIPWCHLDIAGVHATESDSGCFVKGPTGWGVRLLADLLAKM